MVGQEDGGMVHFLAASDFLLCVWPMNSERVELMNQFKMPGKAVLGVRCRTGWVWVAMFAGWIMGWAAAPDSPGQGTVAFVNSTTRPIINFITGMPATAGLVKVGLYYAAPGTPADPGAVPDGYRPVSGNPVINLDNGLFIGGTRTIPDIAPGSPASLQVRAWSAAYSTYEAAYNAALSGNINICIGHSIVMTIDHLGGGVIPTPSLVAQGGLQSFTVCWVPEPSTWLIGLLGALGAAAGAWRRGRRMGAGRNPSQL